MGVFSSLQDYLDAARPAVSRMLGMEPPSATGAAVSPQQRINQGFSAVSTNSPMQDFNQSFGMAPFNSPTDKQAFLAQYMQPRRPAPAPVAAPDVRTASADNAGFYGGSPETNPNLRPMGSPFPWAGSPFSGVLDMLAQRGGEPGAGLISKFVNILGKRNTA